MTLKPVRGSQRPDGQWSRRNGHKVCILVIIIIIIIIIIIMIIIIIIIIIIIVWVGKADVSGSNDYQLSNISFSRTHDQYLMSKENNRVN